MVKKADNMRVLPGKLKVAIRSTILQDESLFISVCYHAPWENEKLISPENSEGINSVKEKPNPPNLTCLRLLELMVRWIIIAGMIWHHTSAHIYMCLCTDIPEHVSEISASRDPFSPTCLISWKHFFQSDALLALVNTDFFPCWPFTLLPLSYLWQRSVWSL